MSTGSVLSLSSVIGLPLSHQRAIEAPHLTATVGISARTGGGSTFTGSSGG
jgi:hypothetical protein